MVTQPYNFCQVHPLLEQLSPFYFLSQKEPRQFTLASQEFFRMATEAKFRITDPGIFWSLQTINQLGTFAFSDPQILEIHDAYLDTKKRKLLSAGYCCRSRKQGKFFLITLTKIGLGRRYRLKTTKMGNCSEEKHNWDG